MIRELLPLALYEPQTIVLGIEEVDANCSVALIGASRHGWPDGPVIRLSMDLSMDGGQNWFEPWIGIEASGGPPDEESNVSSRPPAQFRHWRRLLRGVAIFHQPLRTSIRLEVQ